MKLSRLDRRPWLVSVLAGTGVTLLVPSALSLLAPPELLDSAMALGDRRLALALAALFAIATLLTRLTVRGPGRGDEDPDATPVQPEAARPRGYLR
jgi:hypothetical protein